MLGRLRRTLDALDATRDPESERRLAVATLLVEIARADFHIDPREREAIRGVLASAYGLGDDRAGALVAGAEKAAEEAVSLYEFTRCLNDALSAQEKLAVIEMLWRIAFSDGRLDKHEEHTVRKAADLLHVPHRRFIRAKLKAEQDSRSHRPPAARTTR